MYVQKNFGSRHCFRCQHELTDAASRNEGIGPQCRKLDNAVLARLIPSDLNAALAAYATVDVLSLTPETLETFMKLESTLRDPKAAEMQDWRVSVKRIEWMLSHKQTYHNIEALKAVVLALGYVGLVALWSGEAATGLAEVFVMDGRILVAGPQNKAGRLAFRKIQFAKFHPKDAYFSKPSWSFPASAVREVRLAIITHYPNFDGLHEACETAKAYNAEQDALAAEAAKQAGIMAASLGAVAPVVPAAALMAMAAQNQVSVVEVGEFLKVKTPFRKSYIVELRTTPKDVLPRKWLPEEKVWEFPVAFKPAVEALLSKHFGI